MNTQERLKQYVEEDSIYNDYLNGKTNISDFDKFCIQHCKDIEEILNENQELKKQLEKKYEKVGGLTGELLYEENTKLINQQKEFIEYLDNYIDALKQQKQTVSELDMAEVHILMTLEENLAKYKEIIGDIE